MTERSERMSEEAECLCSLPGRMTLYADSIPHDGLDSVRHGGFSLLGPEDQDTCSERRDKMCLWSTAGTQRRPGQDRPDTGLGPRSQVTLNRPPLCPIAAAPGGLASASRTRKNSAPVRRYQVQIYPPFQGFHQILAAKIPARHVRA